MKYLFYFALVSTLIFVACGGDDSSNPFVASEDFSSSSLIPIEDLSSSSKGDSGSMAGRTSSSHMDSAVSSSSQKDKSSSSVVESSSSFRMSSASLPSSSSHKISISSSSVRNDKLSSSVVLVSSSAIVSSSSDAAEGVTGAMTDERDGQTYKIVKIGHLWWFAQNLNYETVDSHCYNDSAEYCAKYGRLYKWAAAVGKSEEECGYRHECNLTLPVQGVCPSGWRVPSNYDWNDLIVAAGGDDIAGKVLRDSKEGGFALLYAGRINFAGEFVQEGRSACIWSSSETDEYDGYYADFYYSYDKVMFPNEAEKYDGYSVRCVKGEL
jgi:uncharacterized protein (TIGR02145 family)